MQQNKKQVLQSKKDQLEAEKKAKIEQLEKQKKEALAELTKVRSEKKQEAEKKVKEMKDKWNMFCQTLHMSYWNKAQSIWSKLDRIGFPQALL